MKSGNYVPVGVIKGNMYNQTLILDVDSLVKYAYEDKLENIGYILEADVRKLTQELIEIVENIDSPKETRDIEANMRRLYVIENKLSEYLGLFISTNDIISQLEDCDCDNSHIIDLDRYQARIARYLIFSKKDGELIEEKVAVYLPAENDLISTKSMKIFSRKIQQIEKEGDEAILAEVYSYDKANDGWYLSSKELILDSNIDERKSHITALIKLTENDRSFKKYQIKIRITKPSIKNKKMKHEYKREITIDFF